MRKFKHSLLMQFSFGTPMDLDVPEMSADALDRELKSKERVWRNRTSVMEAASKEFTSILSILHSFKVQTFMNNFNHFFSV